MKGKMKYVVIADPGTGHQKKMVFGPFDSAEAGLQFSRAKVKEISAGKDFVDGTEGEWNSAGGKNLDEKFLPWHISAGMDSCQFLVLELSDPEQEIAVNGLIDPPTTFCKNISSWI